MIFRHFEDEQTGGDSYLIASRASREAVIVNPTTEAIPRYRAALEALGVRLVCTLRTERNDRCAKAACALEVLTGARRFAPAHAGGHADTASVATPGAVIPVGHLRIEVVTPPPGYAGSVAYRVSAYTFAGSSVLIDFHETPVLPDGEPEAILDQTKPASVPSPRPARARPIENFRASREGVCLERLILEDLHTSLAESRFTPKEERVARTYVRYLEEHDFAHPSAASLAERLGDVDRTAVHVLVHNIRWKQIDLHRMPLVLAGQTSKWLRGLQTSPEFTSHEREFLAAYLRLVSLHGRPPSGPDIAEALGGGRSVQWVRKRAHTIRRKQREFGMPELVLCRKAPRRHGVRGFSCGGRSAERPSSGIDDRYSA